VSAAARDAWGDIGRTESEPDCLLEGRVFDCSSRREIRGCARRGPGSGVRGPGSGVRKKVQEEQTQRVVVDLEDWEGDLTALRRQFDDWPIPGLREVKANTPNGEIVQLVPRSVSGGERDAHGA
jgi:hypothetical protein